MEDLRAKGGIFRHGGPHLPYGAPTSSSYNDGVLGRVNPVVGNCRARCAAKGTPTMACVSRCIKREPLFGLGQEEVPSAQLSEQMRVLTLTTAFTGLLVAALLVHQMVTR